MLIMSGAGSKLYHMFARTGMTILFTSTNKICHEHGVGSLTGTRR